MIYFTCANLTEKLVSDAGFVCCSVRREFDKVVPENILANEKKPRFTVPRFVQIRYFVVECISKILSFSSQNLVQLFSNKKTFYPL